SIEVAPGELFFLIGPSGCGKTTLLRAIAGLVEPDSGTIFFDEREMTAVPPHRRNAALVFQGYALWPHMTVAQNVEYGLRVRHLGAAERRRRVDEMLAIVQMSDLAGRYPGELSGGQQQRVALARALVVQPDVLLMDEPLSNLDALLRLEMRREIVRIHRQTGITTIYVTHDQKEALSMAQRLAILNAGRIEQTGRPDDCYRRPRTRFAARFLGDANFVEGTLAGRRTDGACEVATLLGRLVVAAEAAGGGTADSFHACSVSAGEAVVCCFRPESAHMAGAAGAGQVNCFQARVRSSNYLGDTIEYDLSAAGGELPLRIRSVAGGRPVPEGSEVTLHVAPENIVLLKPDDR
ncbi:MAG: ABC transporter ATP-binding protein, partial [Candidatus Sumerlaeia bacterium]|nr:ABC transporter ATP-binding protein [Candidatus Sumerlaeia bacterium]